MTGLLASPTGERWGTSVKAVLPAWLITRCLVAVGWVVAKVISDRLVPDRPPLQLDQGLALWDGAWYRRIAEVGFGDAPREALRFFPVYPWLGGLFGGSTIALVVVANVAGLAALVLVRRLVLAEGGSGPLAQRTVLVMSLFPAAGALVWAYAESLLLALSIATWLAARRGRWGWVAVAGLAVGATRPLGVVLAPALALELWQQRTLIRSKRDGLVRALGVVAPVAGLLAVFVNSAIVDGEALAPLRIQEPLRGDWAEPFSRTLRAIGDLLGTETLSDGLHAPFAVAFLVLAAIAVRQLRPGAALYGAVSVLAALAAENLNSLERYGLGTFTLVLVAGTLLHRHQRWEPYYYALSGAGLVALSAMAWTGAYVP